MKQIILKNIHISNFKGIRDLSVEFSPARTDIYGDNATGKTTVFDAFLWLLFGKDSRNASVFNIKPLAVNGTTAQKGVEPTVTATIEHDGKEIELQKVYTEIWKKKRGSTSDVLDKHDIKYFINSVPKTKTEYTKHIASIVDENVFRLLTDVQHFNTQLHWKERREILLEICGDVSYAGVIDSDTKLKPLRGHLTKYTMEEYQKKLAADRTRINKERAELPVRIDEAYKSIVPDIDEKAEKEAIRQLDGTIEDLQKEREAVSGEDVNKEARKIDIQIRALENKNKIHFADQQTQYDRERAEAKAARANIESGIRAAQDDKKRTEGEIERLEAQMEALRKQWREVHAETWSGDGICPSCGQKMPEEMIVAGIKEFNTRKSNRKAEINATGQSAKAKVIELQEYIAHLEEKIAEKEAELAEIPQEFMTFIPEDLPEYAATMALLKQKKEAIEQSGSDGSKADRRYEIDAEISSFKQERSEHEKRLLQAEQNKVVRRRIDELEAKEKLLADEIEKTEKQIYLTEEFARAKVAMLEERINNLFTTARFKLFDQQVNGGLVPCCEVTVDGVPYSDLNSAMRINVGLDVINALAGHYGVTAPIFVDNAETVTVLGKSKSQVIRLVVSEQDKKLRITEVA